MQKQQRLETTVGENHIQQSAQMTQLQGQLQAQGQQFAGQLEGHQQSLHQMFDAQMQQIRSLLSKRQREDGEKAKQLGILEVGEAHVRVTAVVRTYGRVNQLFLTEVGKSGVLCSMGNCCFFRMELNLFGSIL